MRNINLWNFSFLCLFLATLYFLPETRGLQRFVSCMVIYICINEIFMPRIGSGKP
jgi:uncharacterized membrane protein